MHVTDLSFSGYQDAAGLESPRWNRPVGIANDAKIRRKSFRRTAIYAIDARLESQMTHNNNHIRFLVI